jgi:hypothetical protein
MKRQKIGAPQEPAAQGSPRAHEDMIQSAVRLPQGLHERLKKAGGERGMGEEIRQRLEASFAAEAEAPSDQKTRELLEAVSFCAEQVTIHFGSWFEDPFAFQVFKGSVDRLLRKYQPQGDPSQATPKLTETGKQTFGRNDEIKDRSPEELGQTMAQFWFLIKTFCEAHGLRVPHNLTPRNAKSMLGKLLE